MTTIELRNQRIGKITQLTDNHKQAIDVAINQIKNGEFLTNEQVNKDISEWLKK